MVAGGPQPHFLCRFSKRNDFCRGRDPWVLRILLTLIAPANNQLPRHPWHNTHLLQIRPPRHKSRHPLHANLHRNGPLRPPARLRLLLETLLTIPPHRRRRHHNRSRFRRRQTRLSRWSTRPFRFIRCLQPMGLFQSDRSRV